MITDFFGKRKFDLSADRLGPDCPFTHWRLYFKKSMRVLAKNKFLHFGCGAEFRPGAYAITCSKISLGDNVIVRPNTMLFSYPSKEGRGSITIEDNVMVGSGVHIYTSNHMFEEKGKDIMLQGHQEPENVVLQQGCWVGANAIILPGVTVGRNSVVGAGSVVTKSFGDCTVVAGNPAKIIRTL